MPTVTGGTVRLTVDSICVHGDNPQAVAMAARVRAMLREAGYRLAPFLPA